MRLSIYSVLALHFVSVHASLECLGWGLLNPIVGLICHFQPDTFHAVENATINAVEHAVEAVKDLVEFDLTHNPAAIAYEFVNTTVNKGAEEGIRGVESKIGDFGHVSIGFAKESANQVVQIYDLVSWNDVSFCLIKGAANLAVDTRRKSRLRKRVPSTNDVVHMANGCINDKFKQLTNPAVFNITDPNQRVGATISDIAALFVPVGAEENVGVKAAEGAIDLAIPGSEETTRIFKQVSENGAAEHFADEREAQAVADNLRDEEWAKKNCGSCQLSSVPAVGTSKSKRTLLASRGNALASCCYVPETISVHSVDPETVSSAGEEPALEGSEAGTQANPSDSGSEGLWAPESIHDPADYLTLSESEVTQAPVYSVRSVSAADISSLIQRDLDEFSTSIVSWSDEMNSILKPSEFFPLLRKTFSSPSTDELYKALDIRERNGRLRLTTRDTYWPRNVPSSLSREAASQFTSLQDFAKETIKHCKSVVSKTKNLSPQSERALDGIIDFFYSPPIAETDPAYANALAHGVDYRGLHTDQGMMQFGAADVEGLVVKNSNTGKLSRTPVPLNSEVAQADTGTLQCMKSMFWDIRAWMEEPEGLQGSTTINPEGGRGRGSPTWHGVFGPEMVKKGRVSFVVSIYNPALYID